MRNLETITGQQVLNAYIEMYENEKNWTTKDYENFIVVFNKWVELITKQITHRLPVDLSLNKKNYLGKKTRALLTVMEIKEPTTLGKLIGLLWNEHDELYETLT